MRWPVGSTSSTSRIMVILCGTVMTMPSMLPSAWRPRIAVSSLAGAICIGIRMPAVPAACMIGFRISGDFTCSIGSPMIA